MMRKFRKRLPNFTREQAFELSLEFVAIVVGVLFALAVDEWRDDREISQNTRISIERLNEEILSNRKEIQESLNIIQQRYVKLASLRVDSDKPFREYIRDFGGFNFPSLKNSVWLRISHDQIANRIPANYIEEAFQLYNRNDMLLTLQSELNHLSYSETFHDPGHTQIAHGIALNLVLQQIIWSQEALALYDDFINRHIKPVLPDATPAPGNQ